MAKQSPEVKERIEKKKEENKLLEIARRIKDAVVDTIEDLTNLVASVPWANDKDLHDKENWF